MLRDTIIPWSLRLQIHERAVGEDGEEELTPEAITYVLMDWIDGEEKRKDARRGDATR
jgi:hypothetical protein